MGWNSAIGVPGQLVTGQIVQATDEYHGSLSSPGAVSPIIKRPLPARNRDHRNKFSGSVRSLTQSRFITALACRTDSSKMDVDLYVYDLSKVCGIIDHHVHKTNRFRALQDNFLSASPESRLMPFTTPQSSLATLSIFLVGVFTARPLALPIMGSQ